MPLPIAELFVSVSADVSAATRGLQQLGTQLNTTRSSFEQARPAALAMVGASAALGAGFASAISASSDFGAQMASVRANMSPTEVATFSEALRQLALDLGEGTKFSAVEAAEGIEELLKAGIPAEAILGGAGKAALDLAAATGTTVANAGAIAAAAMNAFGLEVSALPGIVDTLAGVTVSTAADIDDLRLGLSDVASVAAGFGLSFEDMAVTIGAFRDAGLTGNTAGTALKTMLVGLIEPTKKQKTLLQELGLITESGASQFFDAAGELKNMAEIAGLLQAALRDMTPEMRQAALVTLFGTQGFQAANILFAKGADGIRRYTTAAEALADAARIAAERQNSLSGDTEKLTGSIGTARIAIGDIFDPVLRGLVQRATELVDRFNDVPTSVQAVVAIFTGSVGAILGLVGGFVLLAPFLASLPAAFTALGVALSAAFGPVGLVVISIAALAAGLVFAFNNNEAFRNSLLAGWDVLQNQFFPAVSASAAALREQLAPILAQIETQFRQIVAEVGPQATEFFANTLPAALSALGTQIVSLGPLFGSVFGFFGAINNLIGTLTATGASALRGLFENVLAPGLLALGTAITPLQPVIQGVNTAVDEMAAKFTTIGSILQPLTDFFTLLTAAINAAATAIQTFQVPEFLRPGSGAGIPGLPGPQLAPAAFTPGGGPAGGGNVVIQGDVNIGSEVDADNFLSRMAALLAGSADRVNVPPDNSGNPSLAPVSS